VRASDGDFPARPRAVSAHAEGNARLRALVHPSMSAALARAVLRTLLAVTLMASTQGMLLVQVAFKANEQFIARTLCVNRARPEVKCNGKCVLAAMQRRAAERDQRQRAHLEAVVLAFVATETTVPHVAAPPADAPRRAALPRPRSERAGPHGVATGIFRPPQQTA